MSEQSRGHENANKGKISIKAAAMIAAASLATGVGAGRMSSADKQSNPRASTEKTTSPKVLLDIPITAQVPIETTTTTDKLKSAEASKYVGEKAQFIGDAVMIKYGANLAEIKGVGTYSTIRNYDEADLSSGYIYGYSIFSCEIKVDGTKEISISNSEDNGVDYRSDGLTVIYLNDDTVSEVQRSETSYNYKVDTNTGKKLEDSQGNHVMSDYNYKVDKVKLNPDSKSWDLISNDTAANSYKNTNTSSGENTYGLVVDRIIDDSNVYLTLPPFPAGQVKSSGELLLLK